jgi:DNA-binding transcriptional LysR family regulator
MSPNLGEGSDIELSAAERRADARIRAAAVQRCTNQELVDVVVLARVIDRGSFAAAAEDFGVPASTLSRRISALEKRLGVRLLERTTRSLRSTEVGDLLAERGRRVRAELDAVEQVVADHQNTPKGFLRISVPTPTASDLLGPPLSEYLRRYPEMKLELVAEDRIVNLVDEGFDATIRLARLSDSTLGAIRLGTIRPVLCAAASYVERAPPLKHPRDLEHHAIVGFGKRRQTWKFVRANAEVSVDVTPRAVSNSAPFVAQLCAGGAGISLLPRFTALAVGLALLEPGGFSPQPLDFTLVTPSARTLTPKLRTLVDLLHAFVAERHDLFETAVPRKRIA